jgi:hypothetical protein
VPATSSRTTSQIKDNTTHRFARTGVGQTSRAPLSQISSPAPALALDDDLAVPQAQFDLANLSACAVNLLGYQRRALQAATRSAPRNVAASVDANGRRRGIEVRLKHKRMMCLDGYWRHFDTSALEWRLLISEWRHFNICRPR